MRRGACIGLGVVLGALLAAAPAGARSHLVAVFHLEGSHGYELRVAAHRAGVPLEMRKAAHRVGKVTVEAEKTAASESNQEFAAARYTVPARFNKHRILADLGPFGHVRLRFHKHPGFLLGPPRAPAQQRRTGFCGQFGFYVPGKFRGTFRFRGEDGYTSAQAHRIHGQLRRDGPVRCRGGTRAIELKAKSGSTRFLALQDHNHAVTSLGAWTRERSGRVEIVRKAGRLTGADAGEFTFDQSLTSAHVAPMGSLFTGSADFASAGSWIGSLAVSFPGEDSVPLTGPGFTTTLRNAKLPARALSKP